LFAHPLAALAATPPGFDAWRDGFRARALAKGISEATWNRAMGRVEPDMSVFKEIRNQPEFSEQIWQYVNRRGFDWRIIGARRRWKNNGPLFTRIEKDYGVERGTLLALWGVESASADPLVQQNICGRYSLRSRRSPGTSRAARPIGRANSSTRSESSIAAGARRTRCGARGRRDGTYAVDAGSLAQCWHRL